MDFATLVERLVQQGHLLRQAWPTFLAVVVLCFLASSWYYGERLAVHEATISNKDSQIEMLEEQLKGAPVPAAIQAKRAGLREKLQAFYVEAGKLRARGFSGALTQDNFPQYRDEYLRWVNSASDWIKGKMGEAARERFLDEGEGSAFRYTAAINDEHNIILTRLAKYRENLTKLIESNSWDSASAS
jgi:hypothetical protein